LYTFFEVELLRDAEPVVEGAAAVFEEAGLGSFATSLRSGLPLATLEATFAICSTLQKVQSVMGRAECAEHYRVPDANELVSGLAFWAEGALLAAADGEIDLFNDCLLMARRLMAEAWHQFAIH
jgi:hypothetical protein